MRILLAISLFLSVSSAFAVNHCDDYTAREPKYLEAIRAVAAWTERSFEELCNLPGVLDIEAQPSRVITREGEVIPHVTVQLHRDYDSCLYKVRNSDKVITSSRCYSGF